MMIKRRIIGIVGILLIALVVALFWYWENGGRQTLTYTDIIAFAEDTPENTIVTKDMLGIMQIEQSTLIEGAITNPDKIIGKETTTYIPARLPLTTKFFSKPELTNGNGKYTFSIPTDWIYAYPQTLRRGDTVYIYPLIRAESKDAYESYNNENDVSPAAIKGLDITKPLLSTSVAYVKDGSNREVVNVGASRYDGSSAVTQIEIIVTEELYDKMVDAYNAGYVFNILYD